MKKITLYILIIFSPFLLLNAQSGPSGPPYYCEANFEWELDSLTNCIEFEDISTGVNGNYISWFWDFGDNSTSTDQNPTHCYQNTTGSGTYLVCLTIMSNNPSGGFICASSYCDTLVLSSNPTYCDITDFEVQTDSCWSIFEVQTTPGQGDILEYQWDFGDGTDETTNIHFVDHTYAQDGIYQATVTIITVDSCSSTASLIVDVNDCGGNPTYCDITDFEVQTDSCWSIFEVQTIPGQGDILEYQWDFGDGTDESTNIHFVDHTYAQDGIYQATVTIITVDSCSSTASLIVDVNDCGGNINYCEAEFYSLPDMANYMNFYFFDISTASNTITSWDWDFGDGSTSNDPNPMHTYQQTGSYYVCLTIISILGPPTSPFTCVSTYCDTIDVTGNGTMPCQADFIAYHDTIISPSNSPYLYHFYDLSMGTPTDWLWDFGDGTTSTDQTPIHTYQNLGNYEVCLSIWDNNFCQSTYCDSILVDTTGLLVLPEFSYNNLGNYSMLFNNMTTLMNSPLRLNMEDMYYLWDFGDGTGSTMENPIHIFPGGGAYNVCLIAIEETTLSGNVICEMTVVVGIEEEELDRAQIYPNPATNHITIETEYGMKFEVFNISGEIVVNKNQRVGEKTILDIANLAPGYYGIRIFYSKDNKIENYKFIKIQ